MQLGETPLYKSSFKGFQKCVELLIEAGAIVDVPQEVSKTIVPPPHVLGI